MERVGHPPGHAQQWGWGLSAEASRALAAPVHSPSPLSLPAQARR